MNGRTKVIGLVLALLLAAVAGTACGSDQGGPSGPPHSSPTLPAGPDGTQPSASTAPALKDWIYRVGTDIQPDTYETTAGDRPCYWARLRSFGGGPESFIAQDNLDPGEHAVVVVEPTDKGFKVANGCEWRPAAT